MQLFHPGVLGRVTTWCADNKTEHINQHYIQSKLLILILTDSKKLLILTHHKNYLNRRQTNPKDHLTLLLRSRWELLFNSWTTPPCSKQSQIHHLLHLICLIKQSWISHIMNQFYIYAIQSERGTKPALLPKHQAKWAHTEPAINRIHSCPDWTSMFLSAKYGKKYKSRSSLPPGTADKLSHTSVLTQPSPVFILFWGLRNSWPQNISVFLINNPNNPPPHSLFSLEMQIPALAPAQGPLSSAEVWDLQWDQSTAWPFLCL